MPTIVSGSFEWDSAKADANLRKHGVSFDEAATTLAHPQAAVFDDGSGKGRLKAIGTSHRGRVLTVIFEERGERDRIISARRSTPADRRGCITGT